METGEGSRMNSHTEFHQLT